MNPLKHISSFLAGPAGVVLLLFFFLPWMTISCSGTNLVEASGFDLATGNAIDELESNLGSSDSVETEAVAESDETSALEADALLWLVVLAGLATLLGVGARYYMNLSGMAAGGLYLVAGALGLVAMVLKYFDLEDLKQEIEDNMSPSTTGGDVSLEIDFDFVIEFSYKYGFYLCFIALAVIVVAGLVAIVIEPGVEEGSAAPSVADTDGQEAKLSAL